MKDNLVIAVIAISILVTSISAISYGISRHEKAECRKWQWQATQYSGYYLTKWQADQCAHYQIKIEAPIAPTF